MRGHLKPTRERTCLAVTITDCLYPFEDVRKVAASSGQSFEGTQCSRCELISKPSCASDSFVLPKYKSLEPLTTPLANPLKVKITPNTECLVQQLGCLALEQGAPTIKLVAMPSSPLPPAAQGVSANRNFHLSPCFFERTHVRLMSAE